MGEINMDKRVKQFNCKVIKKSINEEEHTAIVKISSEAVDRYGEVVRAKAFNKKALENYMANPVLLSSHNYNDLTSCIGKCLKVFQEGTDTFAEFKWFVGGETKNEQAEWGWELVSKHNMASFSIGFIPKSVEDMTTEQIKKEFGKDKSVYAVFDDIEVLENSQVLVPANAEALLKMYDKTDNIFAKEFVKKALDEAIGKEKSFGEEYDKKLKSFLDELENKKTLDNNEEISENKEEDTENDIEKKLEVISKQLDLIIENTRIKNIILEEQEEEIEEEIKPEKVKKSVEETEAIIPEMELRSYFGLSNSTDKKQDEGLQELEDFINELRK